MSEYIYGSSLRAAKSKVNYLFEGDFRRKPYQNLSGASRSLARGELLQQAAEQRQNREDIRQKELASIKIQSLWRGYCSRKHFALLMRNKFDKNIEILQSSPSELDESKLNSFLSKEFNDTVREFVIYYHSGLDETRFNIMIDFILKIDENLILRYLSKDCQSHSLIIIKLLLMNLSLLEKQRDFNESRHLKFLERFTNLNKISVLNETQMSSIWEVLIENKFYRIIRNLVNERNISHPLRDNQSNHDYQSDIYVMTLLEFIRRSLDILPSSSNVHKKSNAKPVVSFYQEFLKGPLDNSLGDFYFPQLINLKPKSLNASYILQVFADDPHIRGRLESFKTILNSYNPITTTTSSSFDKDCADLIWFSYCFVKTIYTQLDGLTDLEKASYLDILAKLLIPADYITNLSLLEAAISEDNDNDNDAGVGSDDDEAGLESAYNCNSGGINQYHKEINNVITKLVELINDANHINGLKSVIFNSNSNSNNNDNYNYRNSELPRVQTAIIQICNLMLSHEPLAIFNCRLLYTIAFNRDFTRNLWKSITTLTVPASTISFGFSSSTSCNSKQQPIYTQLTLGQNITQAAWELILPRLRLFCALYSYLLPTLDDVEFYANDDNSLNRLDEKGSRNTASDHNSTDLRGNFDKRNEIEGQKQAGVLVKQSSNSASDGATSDQSCLPSCLGGAGKSFFLNKELINMTAILRDICVGFIEIIYQSKNHPNDYSLNYNLQQYATGSRESSSGYQNERSKLLAFGMRVCFKALVRLICQLHARDSRKQFCPNGHWICPSVAIPANKAIDFQLLSKQQGRLIRQMTRDIDNSNLVRASTVTSSEIKTALILQEIPFVVSFQDRVQILHQLLKREKLIYQSDMANYHFGLPGGAIMLQVRRNYIYEDAFDKLSTENEPNLKLPLKVSLINELGAIEAGIDGGGVSKEFLSELLKAGFDPMRGFFKSTNDQLLYPNPSANVLFSSLSEGYAVHYEFLGRILGKAIFEKIMVELPLASFFLAKLLARRHSSDVDLHNLASLDPVLYKNLVYLKNYKDDVAELNLDFTIANNELDEHEIVELKPGGANILVTRENKIEYVHLVADYRLNKQIRAQCAAFKRGISQVIDLDWLRMFDSRELQILISGAPTMIDTGDWRRHTLYANGYSDDCDVIVNFWRVVSSFDENQKRKLLKFATSCSLPPLLGFKDLVPEFSIAPSEEGRLPTASTCINLLKLPPYEDEKTMRSKILYAIESNSGFELS